jgi:hypothetical protein
VGFTSSRIVCPRIPLEGAVDLTEFHRCEGPKYMIGYGAFAIFTIATNTYFGVVNGAASSAGSWLNQNADVIPMAFAAFVGGFVADRRVQVSAVAVELIMWTWYFWSLQGALSG